MKRTSLPPLRVSEELRREVEGLLGEGETLSSFVLDAVTRSVQQRRAQREFIARGLAGAQEARETGHYIPASQVLGKLEARLDKARRGKRRAGE
jgi:predicted transcriptional regulator